MTTEILIILPLLSRPHRVHPVLASLAEATPEPHRVVCVCTQGDSTVIERVREAGVDLMVEPPHRTGDYAKKVNRAYRESDEPFLFLGADDLRFELGWWTAAKRQFDANPAIGVVGTNDLAPTERARQHEHSTHSVVRRSYVDAHGLITGERAILYEGYPHEYVDDELVGTAKKRQAWCYAADSVVEHLHPHWGKAKMDPLYRLSSRRMQLGRHLVTRRRKLWT